MKDGGRGSLRSVLRLMRAKAASWLRRRRTPPINTDATIKLMGVPLKITDKMDYRETEVR